MTTYIYFLFNRSNKGSYTHGISLVALQKAKPVNLGILDLGHFEESEADILNIQKLSHCNVGTYEVLRRYFREILRYG